MSALAGEFDDPADMRARLYARCLGGAYWASGSALALPAEWPRVSTGPGTHHLVTTALALGLPFLGWVLMWFGPRFRLGAGLFAFGLGAVQALHPPAFAYHRVFLALLFALSAAAPRGKLAPALRAALALLYASAGVAKLTDPAFLCGERLRALATLLSNEGAFFSIADGAGQPLWWRDVIAPARIAPWLYPAAGACIIAAELLIAAGYARASPLLIQLGFPLHLAFLLFTGSPFGAFFFIGWLGALAFFGEERPSPRMSLWIASATVALAGPLSSPIPLALGAVAMLVVRRHEVALAPLNPAR